MAAKLPTPADITKVYDAQELVISSQANFSTVQKFDPLLELHRAAFGPTNLSIRQHVIMGRYSQAIAEFKSLLWMGAYVEGPDYFEAVKRAFEWDTALTWDAHPYKQAGIPQLLASAAWIYAHLVDPTGRWPLPESRTSGLAQVDKPDPALLSITYPSPAYCVVTRGGFWALINLMGGCVEHNRNLHARPAFASYVASRDGTWLPGLAPYKYEGYSNDELKRETTRWNTPKGAFAPEWRLNPPKCDIVSASGRQIVARIRTPRRFLILPGKTITRTFTFGTFSMDVTDRVGDKVVDRNQHFYERGC